MKYFKTLTLLLLGSLVFLSSCNDSTKATKDEVSKSLEVEDSITKSTTTTPPLKEPAQNALGVWHYTCRIGCPGGSGTATACKTCGNILIHNTVYHGNTNEASSNTFSQPSATQSSTPAKEPAQNAAGVWHYTCSNGCAGGSGAAGSCASCNGTLAHNSAYH